MPSPVDKYVKEVRKSNPDYSESQVWATAWSIYCKHKNPGSEHCKKPAGEYFKEKSAMDEMVLRVAAKSQVSPEQAIRVAEKFARSVYALDVGKTYENESWRIHRFSTAIRVTDLTNAGKRGKKVETIAVYLGAAQSEAGLESVAMEFVMNARRGASFEKMKTVAEEALHTIKGLGMQITIDRGVDVMPGDFKPIKIDGEFISLEAGYTDFSVNDKVDTNNLPACIPRFEGGKKSIPVFYRWVKDNKKKIKKMKFPEVLAEMGKNGIEFHSYCRMD